MRNIIRADLYAIKRGKALYITFGLVLLLNILLIIATHSGGGIHIGFTIDAAAVAEMANAPQIELNGIQMLVRMYSEMDNLMYFLLPLVLVAAAPIFKHGTVKNDIAWGISRTKLYFSKLTVAVGLCLMLVLFHMGTGTLIATVIFGWGGAVPDAFWSTALLTIGAQTFMLLALTCIGVFLVFTFKRTAMVNGAYLAFLFVPPVLLSIFHEIGFDISRVMNFDMMLGMGQLSALRQLDTGDIIMTLGMGAFYILATILGGLALFKRAEIK